MAKKKINILLLAVVLGLWGTVAYRYLNRFFAGDAQKQADTHQQAATFTARQKDTFELSSVSRDPFLNRLTAEKKTAGARPRFRPPVAKKEVKPVVQTPFPSVGYFGYVKSGQQKELVVLKINGKLVKLHAGEARDGFKVGKIYKDSVQVSAGGQTQYIKRNK